MQYPVDYITITQPFSSGHRGLDLGWSSSHGGQNVPIYAVESGTVISIQYQSSGGNVVHIRHNNGYVSEYGHLKSYSVRRNQTVTRGQQIGIMGNTGVVTGTHLHLGIVQGTSITYSSSDVWIDPLTVLYVTANQEVSPSTASNYNLLYDTNRTWISINGYLSQAQMENNAIIVINYYRGLGFNDNTIAAILGNMQAESTLSPILEEVGGSGYGLVQWTPKQVLIDHVSTLGLSDYTNGNTQIAVIPHEVLNESGVAEWYSSSAFISNYYNSGATSDMIGITGTEFLHNTMNWSADKLAVLFMVCYERPAYDPNINHYENRKTYALNWLAFMGGVIPPTPIGGRNKRGFNFVLFDRKRRMYING